MKQTLVLAILDGWGIGSKNESNPIYIGHPDAFEYIEANYPSVALQASGIAVGLPWEDEGNSEVGHITIGAGKILYQHYPRITLAIEDGSFFKNEAITGAFTHTKQQKSAVHFVGMLSSGNVHSAFSHLSALISYAKQESIQEVYLHLFSDGRDCPPESLKDLIKKLESEVQKIGNIKAPIADIAGRAYGMDRNKRWEKIEFTFNTLVGKYPASKTIEEITTKTYAKGLSDEFIEPAVIEFHPIRENDAVIFFNFREDRMRQIVESFINPEFKMFKRDLPKNLFVVGMTEYDTAFNAFPYHVAFPNEHVNYPIGRVLSENGKTQLHIAETEKYAHVTMFFNGLREIPFENEFRIMIPSRNVIHHDEYPQMMAEPITDRVIASLKEGVYDFIVVNYANPDMVAHTGNFDATLKAIETINTQMKRLIDITLQGNHVLCVTSDHGNAEVLLDMTTGLPETKHNKSPVPFYLIGNQYKKQTPQKPIRLQTIGMLADIAPTLLEIMRLPKPAEMTGQSLLEFLLE